MSLIKQSDHSYRFECMIKGQRFYKTYTTYNEPMSKIKEAFLEWKISCNKDLFYNNTYTLEEFSKIWITDYCENYSPCVLKNYRCNLKNWILPRLGKFKLSEITPLVLDGFVNHLKSTNSLSNSQAKLSNNTIKKIWNILHAIISCAYRKNLIANNPAEKVDLGLRRAVEPGKTKCWDVLTYQRALSLLSHETSDNARLIEFAVKTGLRRSEIWGLTWKDIDLQTGELTVNKTLQKVNGKMQILPCKTASSVRTITLPASLISMLNKYRETHQGNFYVFQNLDCDAVPAWFRKWQRKNNIPKIRFHDLRHTHASLLLYQSVDIKTISERLGHSNIGITMNTYTHVMHELDVKAAKAIDNI